MTKPIPRLYEFVLAQMAGEAYLEGLPTLDRDRLEALLRNGNNRDGFPARRFVRFTESQIDEFLSKYRVVDQLSDDPNGALFRDNTGLSATLIRKLNEQGQETNEYVFSIRSTEFPNAREGGDFERDATGGGGVEIARAGYAMAQLTSLEAYYERLKASRLLPAGAKLEVTGYSLGGHLAAVFTELHAAEIEQTVLFNAAGRGRFNARAPLQPGVELASKTVVDVYRAVLADPDHGWEPFLRSVRWGDKNPLNPEETVVELWARAQGAAAVDQFTPQPEPRSGYVYSHPRHQWAYYVASQLGAGVLGNQGTGLSAQADAKIVDVFGHATHDDAEGVAALGVRGSRRQQVFIEDQPALSGLGGFFGLPGDFGNTHSLTLIADSLALMRAIQRIDPNVTQAGVQAILAAGSNLRGEGLVFFQGRAEADSLETVLDALRRLLVSPTAERTPFSAVDGGFGDLANRNSFFEHLGELEAAVKSQTDQGMHFTIAPLIDPQLFRADNGEPIAGALPFSADQLHRRALEDSPTGAAYRYALRELNPFVVFVRGGTLDAYLDPAISQVDAADGVFGGASREYWADRARLLERRVFAAVHGLNNDYLNPVNSSPEASPLSTQITPYANETVVFDDKDIEYFFRAQLANNIKERVTFGLTGASNDLPGGSVRDRVYGGRQADELRGGNDDDYLDGGGGPDRLFGDAEKDVLVGGDGDDALDGGRGVDILKGGRDFDTYVLRSGEEPDVIFDSDGRGQVILDGRVLNGGKLVQGNSYSATDGSGANLSLTRGLDGDGATLIINDRISVLGFRNGDLGITLDTAPDAVSPPSGFAYTYFDTQRPTGSEDQSDPALEQGSDANDFFRSTIGGLFYAGKGGDDVFEGETILWDDFSGGAGNDALRGAALDSNPPSFGQSGDTLYGDAGNDLLVGTPFGDSLHGDFREVFGRMDVPASGTIRSVVLGSLLIQPETSSPNSDLVLLYRSAFGFLGDFDVVQIPTRFQDFAQAFAYALGPTNDDGTRNFDDRVSGAGGNDAISGGYGSDGLFGGDGDDTIYGDYNTRSGHFDAESLGEFAALFGKPGDDIADGGDGNDTLLDTEGGSDTLIGGPGNDKLENSEDAAFFEEGFADQFSNLLDGGSGNDTIASRNPTLGADILLGGDGDDAITFQGATARVDGGAGADRIEFTGEGRAAPSQILGGSGNDEIEVFMGVASGSTGVGAAARADLTVDAGDDDDIVRVKGSGAVSVFLGPGNDEIRVSGLGSLFVTLDQRGTGGADFDRIIFDSALSRAIASVDVVASRSGDDLLISPVFAAAPAIRDGAWVAVSDWFAGAESQVDEIVFQDGAVWTPQTVESLVARNLETSTDNDDILVGSSLGQVLLGGVGDDQITGRGVHDVLEGGVGADLLRSTLGGVSGASGGRNLPPPLPRPPGGFPGGGGPQGGSLPLLNGGSLLAGGGGDDTIWSGLANDILAFNRGEGADTVQNASGGTVSLGGTSVDNATLRRSGNDLLLDFSGGDALRFAGWYNRAPGITPFRLQAIASTAVAVYDLRAALSAFASNHGASAPGATWSPGSAWADYLVTTNLDSAFGGRLAFEYALHGTTSGLSSDAERSALYDSRFGNALQPLQLGRSLNEHLFNSGSGVAQLATTAGVDTVRFGEGITPDMITLGLGSLAIRVGDSGAELHLTDFDPSDALAPNSIGLFRFSDGTTLTYDQLLSRGFDLFGTTADDVITGTNVADRIQGGPGDDVLLGGEGSDVYFFARGSGRDRIEDTDSDRNDVDRIKLVGTFASGDVRVRRNGSELVLSIVGTNDHVAIRWEPEFGYAIESVEFPDGTVQDIESLQADANQAPVATPDAASVIEDETFVASGNVLANDTDPDAGDVLSVAAPGTYAGRYGTLDIAARGAFTYALDSAKVEVQALAEGASVVDSFAYEATDGEVSSAAVLSVAVTGRNDAPQLAAPIADESATEDEPFAFAVPVETFSDEDAGDTLVLRADLASGDPLPAWLEFAPGSAAFSGTPANSDVGLLRVRVAALDAAGASASAEFDLDIVNVNDAPLAMTSVPAQFVEAGATLEFALPAGAFADPDAGDALSLSATHAGGAALPAWLSFDAAATIVSARPGVAEIGLYRVELTATDRAGETAASGFNLTVTAPAGATVTGDRGDDVILGGGGAETLIGRGGDDFLAGLAGDDLLRGGRGFDVLQGGSGSDVLRAGLGQNLLDGGADDDVLYGGPGAGVLAGGRGNDLIRAGRGSDVILFNRGDGNDALFADRGADNTLSLGGIRLRELALSKLGRDLVLELGAGESITFRNWYGGRTSLANLQIITDTTTEYDPDSLDPLINRRVANFDFLGFVAAFDAARKAQPGLSSWALTDALTELHLSGSDDAALGGDLAYQYASRGTFEGLSLAAAQDVLRASSLGAQAQQLRPLSGLQEGFATLVA